MIRNRKSKWSAFSAVFTCWFVLFPSLENRCSSNSSIKALFLGHIGESNFHHMWCNFWASLVFMWALPLCEIKCSSSGRFVPEWHFCDHFCKNKICLKNFYANVHHADGHLKAQISVFPHNFNNFSDFSCRFCSHSSPRIFINYNPFPILKKSSVPFKYMRTWHSIITKHLSKHFKTLSWRFF